VLREENERESQQIIENKDRVIQALKQQIAANEHHIEDLKAQC